MTIYLTLGGRNEIMRAMPRLQARLEEDPCFDLAGFRQEFERSDDFAEFLIFLFGGAPFYEGKPISALLSPLCTCADVYDRFVDHLVAVYFGEGGMADSEEVLRELMQRLRPQVLNPKPTSPVLVYSVGPDRLSA